MGAALPADVTLVDQLEEGFVNQSSRLQRVLGPFTPEIAHRHSAQFPIDDWHEGVECFAIATGPARKQLRDVARRQYLHESGMNSIGRPPANLNQSQRVPVRSPR